MPTRVLQEELLKRDSQLSVCDTIKVTKIVGDSGCPEMCAVSVYDTKPMHFLTMYNREIKWIKKKRKVFNKGKNLTEKMNFLCLNITSNYTNGMEQVNIEEHTGDKS